MSCYYSMFCYTEMCERIAAKRLMMNSGYFYIIHGIFLNPQEKSHFYKNNNKHFIVGRQDGYIMTVSIVLFPKRWSSYLVWSNKGSWLFCLPLLLP